MAGAGALQELTVEMHHIVCEMGPTHWSCCLVGGCRSFLLSIHSDRNWVTRLNDFSSMVCDGSLGDSPSSLCQWVFNACWLLLSASVIGGGCGGSCCCCCGGGLALGEVADANIHGEATAAAAALAVATASLVVFYCSREVI